ncbi:MAG TPA: hypothetical protein VJ814_00385 [Gaiellaceae bacterium]|nr:hypothetical protein [Gaiellaceae bacterium]
MRGRRLLLLLMGSGLVFLASLYLRWRTLENAAGNFDGWGAVASYAAALIAVALVLAAAAALVRPTLVARLPLGGLGVSLGYFAAASAIQLTAFSVPLGTSPPGGWTAYAPLHWGWSYGVYVGGASGGTAALAALVLRRQELARRRTVAEAVPVALALGLLVSFLLPWQALGSFSVIGLVAPAAMVAAAGLLLGAGRLARAGLRPRLAAVVALAMLTGAAASGIGLETHYAYGAWIGIGSAVALVALEASRAGALLRMPGPPERWIAVRSAAAALLLVALFLPWLDYGFPQGRSFSTDGWEAVVGTGAGVLALLLLVATAVPWVARHAPEATFGSALLVATFGIQIGGFAVPSLHLGSGAYLGFAAVAILLLAQLGLLHRPSVDRRRAVVRAVPVLASVACVGAAVVPAWQGVLPPDWLTKADAVRNWFSVAALLLALHLLRLWIERIASPSTPTRGLVLTPLLILPLPVLELVHERSVGIVWGGLILVCLCLLLAALGWLEQRGGLERFRLPEGLRLDRLPEAET